MNTHRKLQLSAALTAGLLGFGASGAQEVYNPDLTNHTVAGQWTVVGPDAALGNLDRAPTLRLGVDGTLGGFAGCNRLTGTYAARGSAFVTLPLGLTRMACDPAAMQAEQNVVSRLQTAYQLHLSGDTLRLHSKGGDLLLRRTGPALHLSGSDHAGHRPTSIQPPQNRPNQKGGYMQRTTSMYFPTLEQGGKRLALGSDAGFAVEVQGDQVTLSGKVGCNQMRATATTSGSTLTFGGVQSTRMLCAPAEAKAEAALTALLGGPVQASQLEDGWKLAGSSVTLTLKRQAQGQEAHQTEAGRGGSLLGHYRARSFTLDGHPVNASNVSVSFYGPDNATPVAATAGCNTLGFGIKETAGKQVLSSPLPTTLVMCGPEATQHEEALRTLLAGAEIVRRGDSVTLQSGRGELVLAPMTDADAGVDGAALLGSYNLTSVAKGGQPLDLAGYGKPVTLTLQQSEGGDMLRLGGTDGCNTFGGTATLQGSTLQARDLMGTLVFCSSLETLPDLGKQLLSGAEVRLQGKTLVLQGQQGGESLTWTFERQ